MIYFNDILIKREEFGDGTLKCNVEGLKEKFKDCTEFTIKWLYENDNEIFLLISLKKFIDNEFLIVNKRTNLILPYIPNARQDRFVSGRLFTLEYFAGLINLLGFKNVIVFDPHSKVSNQLIFGLEEMDSEKIFYNKIKRKFKKEKNAAIMFPDNGANEKYLKKYPNLKKFFGEKDCPVITGIKHRDINGRIYDYELGDFPEEVPETVVIIDDICSYGGTFSQAADKLKEKGVKNIYLVVSHSENNIYRGDVLTKVDKVFTTDSIFNKDSVDLMIDIENPKELKKKIEIVTSFK